MSLKDAFFAAQFAQNGGSGLTDSAKAALLTCFRHTAWTDQNGSLYYMALANALNADPGYITAVYTPSGTVYTDDALNTLKSNLVVTFYADDQDDGTVISSSLYTLSGTLTEGTSTVTVSYSGVSTTFNVTVTANTVVSVSAVLTQGGNIISSSDELEDLRNFLVVTANYANGTSIAVTDYTLSGNLNSAQSTIAAVYDACSTTFTVNVTMLPSGYTAKTYVQTDGTQYITTTIPETEFATSGFRTKTMVPTLVDRAGHLFSSANLRAPYLFYYGSYNRKYINTNRYGNETRTGYTGSFNDWAAGTVYVIEGFMQGHDAVTLNGTKLYDCSAGSTSSSSNYMAIFTYYPQLSVETWRFRGNLYYIKAFNSDMTKQYDFVPCVNSSNVAGLYDLVHGVFYSPTVGTLATD